MSNTATKIAPFDVTSFDVEFENAPGQEGRSYIDITAHINGQRLMIAFATKTRGHKGYTLVPMSATERIYGEMHAQAELFGWYDHHNGLTATEVKQRGYILAGLALAAQTTS